MVTPKEEAVEKVDKNFWGFRKAIVKNIPLVQVTGENYLDIIFGRGIGSD